MQPVTSSTQDPYEQYRESQGNGTPSANSQKVAKMLNNSEMKAGARSGNLGQSKDPNYTQQTGSQRMRDKLLINSGESLMAQKFNGAVEGPPNSTQIGKTTKLTSGQKPH